MSVRIVYHKGCVDGIVGALMVKKIFPRAPMLPLGAGVALSPGMVGGRGSFLAFVDVLPPNLWEFRSFVAFDHHTYADGRARFSRGDCSEPKCASLLVWESLQENDDKPVPRYLRAIDQRDRGVEMSLLEDAFASKVYLETHQLFARLGEDPSILEILECLRLTRKDVEKFCRTREKFRTTFARSRKVFSRDGRVAVLFPDSMRKKRFVRDPDLAVDVCVTVCADPGNGLRVSVRSRKPTDLILQRVREEVDCGAGGHPCAWAFSTSSEEEVLRIFGV